MGFSNDELLFLSNLFKRPSKSHLPKSQRLTIHSAIPNQIACLLKNANLTLLAEVGQYQLWFPLEFSSDKHGIFTPILSAPEVIDTQGAKRSWRCDKLNIKSDGFSIESISSTGVLLKPTSKRAVLDCNQQVQFDLPNKQHIILSVEPVRQSKQGVAAKITHFHSGKEHLRAYLFNMHKRQYANLYSGINAS